jgi:hypothetical protein
VTVSVHIFGIRHHGPGCARSLRAALEALAPDVVLVEGPPDAEPILPLLAHAAMRPPVAMLIYVPDAPQRAVFYPFAQFSPEWQALRYAAARGVPARFMDLPQAIQLAGAPDNDPVEGEERPDQPADEPARAAEAATGVAPDAITPDVQGGIEDDPIGALAEAAGYGDRELWWELQVEQRVDAVGLFEGIMEAMTALRAAAGPPRDGEARREAHMRQAIRAARDAGFERVAVVCGAWHAPVLADDGDPAADAALLAGLPRVPVAATWIPWTSARLAYRSGYGAGIASPGWYAHLWEAPDRPAVRWVSGVAQLLRGEDLDASPASVIEAVRAAEALAALRDLPMPGLAELDEAVLAVLCQGDAAPMRLIRERLTIGEAMGAVPPETPGVPLQRDLEAQQRRLRLPPSPAASDKVLDLRKDHDHACSRLLHRLRLLGIPWGEPRHGASGAQGTFHEVWRLSWQPDFAVRLIEANVHGNTVEAAATGFALQAAQRAAELPDLTALLDAAVPAELPAAVAGVLARIQAQAAVSADVRHLMDALPPLARVARYGDVRGTDPAHVVPILDGLFARAVLGLPGACASLDDDAATAMGGSIDGVAAALALLDRDDLRAPWHDALARLADRETVHGLVRGRCCRLLLEAGALDDAELRRLAGLALSPAVPAEAAAAWVEGLVRGSGLALLHLDGLWAALDGWLRELAPETFVAVLPLLRRAFAGVAAPERRAMGERLARLGRGGAAASAAGDVGATVALDHERARGVLPVLAHILGVSDDGNYGG